MKATVGVQQRKSGSLRRVKHRTNQSVKIVAGDTLLHIDADPSFSRRKCYQPVTTAMADIETHRSRPIA